MQRPRFYPAHPRAVNLETAAKLLGVSYWTIRRGIRAGTIPYVAVTPRTIRVPLAAIESILKGRRAAALPKGGAK